MSAKTDDLLPGFAWNFGPGANGVGHSFTLSGEGDSHKQMLTAFWQRLSPSLRGWTFYATKQPSPEVMQSSLRMGALTFKPIEFWLTPYVDKEEEKIDLTIWHPLFPQMEEDSRSGVSFLYLDEMIGEIDTGRWVGRIELIDRQLASAIPLSEIPSFIDKTRQENGWVKQLPGESWTAYEGVEPHRGEMRGDIVAGATCQFGLVAELEDGALDPDPLADWGADYVFIAFDVTILPKGNEVEARGEIQDALASALKDAASGRLLGGSDRFATCLYRSALVRRRQQPRYRPACFARETAARRDEH